MFLAIASCCWMEENGLAAPEKMLITAIQMKTGLHGNQKTPECGAIWITDAQSLALHFREIESNVLGSNGKPPTLDFTREGVLLVNMGSKTTAGYQLTMASNSVIVHKGLAELSLAWIEPEPGTITAQILTSPYLMLRLPSAGIKRIRVLDQNLKTRIEIETK